MKQPRLFLIGLLATGLLTFTGCGGGGGGGNGGDGGNGVDPTPVTNTTFNLVNLTGLAGGSFSAGIAINNGGLAVGFSDDGINTKAAKWTVTDAAPAATLLSPLDGNTYSAAYGVNAAGVSVGESGAVIATVPDANTVAVFWTATAAQALPATGLFADGASAAYAISDDGKVIGEAVNDAAGNTAAIVWPTTATAPIILGNLPGGTFASAYFIGADGRIIGEARNSAGQVQAVVWAPAAGGAFTAGQAPTPLAELTGQLASVALGVEANGRIVGEAELPGNVVHGVIWNADGTIAADLGANTSLQAINAGDRLVGYSTPDASGNRAAIWNGANLADTKTINAAGSQAFGINASSQIIGSNGVQAFAAIPQYLNFLTHNAKRLPLRRGSHFALRLWLLLSGG
jgi:uncharacterized membrane protein